MNALLVSFIVGVVATEVLYFKVFRKRIVRNTQLPGIKYTFRDFLIEKGFSGLLSLAIAWTTYDFLIDYKNATRFIIGVFGRIAVPVMILMFLVFMILVNWYFSLRLEKKKR